MNEWEHSTRRNAVLQNKIRDYREDIRRARDEKWESRGHIQRCERENRDLKQQNKDLKRDRDAARGRVSRVQANLAEVVSEVQNVRSLSD